MANKQPHLSAAFYGPAIPPPANTRHRHGRGCLCSLLGTFLKVVIGLVVAAGIIMLILWLVFRPNELKFDVTAAKLTQFNLTGDQLQYNLALNLTVRNPNKRYGVYYDSVEASAVYKNQRLQTQWLPPSYQGHKTTAVLSAKFDGERVVVLGSEQVAQFHAEKLAGVFHIDVKLFLRIRLRSGEVIGKFKPDVSCELKVPLSSGSESFVWFQTTPCHFHF